MKNRFHMVRGGKGGPIPLGDEPDIVIRSAEASDAATIFEMAEAYRLQEEQDCAKAASQGFLLSGYTSEDYRVFAQRLDHFYLLIADGVPAAFILGASREYMEDSLVFRELAARDDGPFVYVYQVCAGAAHQGRGFATRLYHHLFSEADVTAYASVVDDEKLSNERSLKLHQKLGFTRQFEYRPEDGYRRVVLRRAPSAFESMDLLAYSFIRAGAVAAATLALSLVIAISSGEVRILLMTALVLLYFVALCLRRYRLHASGEMFYVVAECVDVNRLSRSKVEYAMDMCLSWREGNYFYLTLPKKRRLREGEYYEMLFLNRADGNVSEANLVTYRKIPNGQIYGQGEG